MTFGYIKHAEKLEEEERYGDACSDYLKARLYERAARCHEKNYYAPNIYTAYLFELAGMKSEALRIWRRRS